MEKIIKSFFIVVLFFAVSQVMAQGNGGIVFDINEIKLSEDSKTVNILMGAYKMDGLGGINSLGSTDPAFYTVDETIKGEEKKSLLIKSVEYISENVSHRDNKMVYILIDASASMHENGYTDAKSMLKDLFNSNSLKENDVRVAWFNDGLVQNKSTKMKDNSFEEFETLEKSIVRFSQNSNLIKSLSDVVEELSQEESQKVVLLFSNGHSVIKENEKNQTKLDSLIKENFNRYQIYPIGVGAFKSTEYLKTFPARTISPIDGISKNKIPDGFYQSLLLGKDKFSANLKITVKLDSESSIVGMEPREYIIRYDDRKGSKYGDRTEVVFNPSSKTYDTRADEIVEFGFKEVLIAGVGLVFGLLAMFWIAIPLYTQFNFKRNHVKKYREIKKAGVTASDPLTLEPIKDEQTVVVMGRKVMLLETWKYLKGKGGETSKDHAEFFEKQMSGNFFNQRGAFQRLNWVWFGALGGFLSWGLDILLSQYVHLGFYKNFLQTLLDSPGKQISSAVYSSTIIGVSMAAGIVSCLAFVDELGTSRSFNALRIIKRVLIGIALSIPLFFIESLLTIAFSSGDYIGGLLGWTLFGTAIGFTVTLYSGIQKKNGLIGGFISGVIAFHFYYLLQHIPQIIDVINSDFSRVISFILYGGILGYFLFRVIFKLEDFELIFLSPEPFVGRKNPISKWLKSTSIEAIYIGADPACEIKVKWAQQDTRASILPFHAKMTYEDGQVYIEPMPVVNNQDDDAVGEKKMADVLVNNVPVRKKFMLQNDDRIKLGVYSISIMQFKSRNKNNIASTSNVKKDKVKSIAVRVTTNRS